MAEDEELYKNDNPLDEYTKMALRSVTSKLHIRSRVYYCCDARKLPFLDYQLIAEVSCPFLRFSLDFGNVQTELSEYDVLSSQVRALDRTACCDRAGSYLRVRLVNEAHGGL